MAQLKSYTCSKCAGILMFDSDQEFFDCPFCGNRFDIVDFHADEVLDQAKACLEQGAFSAANDKFDQILDNDPHNFEALLGNVLCVLNLSSEEKLEDSDNLKGKDLTGAKKALINAGKLSAEVKADYFTRFLSLIENYEKSVKFEKEKDALLYGDIQDLINQKMLSDFKEFRSEDRASLPWPWIVLGVFILLSVVVISSAMDDSWVMAVKVMLFFAFLAAIVIMIFKKDNEHDVNYRPGNDYEKKLTDRIQEYNRNYSRCYSKMRKFHASIANEDQAAVIAEESKAFSDSEIDPSQNISCAKCGAGLSLDKNKRVYQCDHCGVAYGVSLFFGLPMEKALNSLNNGRYKDAGQRFSNLLMVDPSDFEALLGKVLCAGKWTKVSDISLSDDLDEGELQLVRTSLEEAGKHASESDRSYFGKMEQLISLFEPYAENQKQLEALNSDVADMETKADVYAIAFEGANYDEKYKKERQELLNKTFPAQVKIKKLKGDFDIIMKELIEEKSACRLVK